jgi:hypothetical protein
MSKRRGFGHRLANIADGVTKAELDKVMRELGPRAGRRRCLVVRVMPGETEAQAHTRVLAMTPLVAELSPEARARLSIIVVVRNHTRSTSDVRQEQAWNEARALFAAGASITETAERSGYSELEVRERAAAEGWAETSSP